MPPRKNVVKSLNPDKQAPTDQQAPEKAPKKKPKIEKSKFKKPKIIKVKIQPSKSLQCKRKVSTGTNKCNLSPTLPTGAQMKIDLANQVARAQLVKPGGPAPVVTVTVPATKVTGRKPRGRPRRNREDLQPKITCATDPTEGAEGEAKKTPKKEPAESENTVVNAAKVTRKRKTRADSTSPKKPRSAKIKTDTTQTNQMTNKCATRPQRKKAKKGKDNNVEDLSSIDQSSATSPSLLKIANESVPVVKKTRVTKKPKAIESRHTSMVSTTECPSWTKDISSSSTTTCVSVYSSDFVRIDNKLPVLKLSNIGCDLKRLGELNDRNSMNADGSDSLSIKQTTVCDTHGSPDLNAHSRSLNLSTSSETSRSSHDTTYMHDSSLQDSFKEERKKIDYALEKLSAKLKKLDLEIVNWVGYDNETAKKLNLKFLNALPEEKELIMNCRNLNRVLGYEPSESLHFTDNNGPTVKTHNELNFIQPSSILANANVMDTSEEDENFTSTRSRYVLFNENCTNKEDEMLVGSVPEPEENNLMSAMSFDHTNNNDDGDTLSLYAESITFTTSVGPTDFYEEYVPMPISTNPHQTSSYSPTKIKPNGHVQQPKTRIVCEKQSADSTSVQKEGGDAKCIKEKKENIELNSPNRRDSAFKVTNALLPNPIHALKDKVNKQSLICAVPVLKLVNSCIYKGVCFFNLISKCKKIQCAFPHMALSILEVKNRLAKLSEDMFKQEYKLLCNYAKLRQMYGMCYIEECARRDLTRMLVEMAIDFNIPKDVTPEDTARKVDVNEFVLMQLNEVDLGEYADLLIYSFSNEALLCDVFMQTIAETQNFSRFKQVFINLTHFITGQNRTFNLYIASHILERFCFLPFEVPLYGALLEMIKNSDASIFEDPMVLQCEKKLAFNDKFYAEFLALKQQAFANRDSDQIALRSLDREQRYTSPDTTKMDNLSKGVEEPKRTVVFEPSQFKHIQSAYQHSNSPISSDSIEDFRQPAKKPRFNMWKSPSTFNAGTGFQGGTIIRTQMTPEFRPPMKTEIRALMQLRPNLRPQLRPNLRPQSHPNLRPQMRPNLRPQMRPPMNRRHFNQRHVAYGQSIPPHFRRPGPDFY